MEEDYKGRFIWSGDAPERESWMESVELTPPEKLDLWSDACKATMFADSFNESREALDEFIAILNGLVPLGKLFEIDPPVEFCDHLNALVHKFFVIPDQVSKIPSVLLAFLIHCNLDLDFVRSTMKNTMCNCNSSIICSGVTDH